MNLKTIMCLPIWLFIGISMYFYNAICGEINYESELRKRGSVLNKNNKWR